MGLFRKSKYDPYEGHNNNLFSDDDDDDFLMLDTESFNRFGGNHRPAPHALTVDEVVSSAPEEIKMSKAPSPGSVYDRLKERQSAGRETALDDDYVPSWATAGSADNKSEPAPVPEKKEPAAPAEQDVKEAETSPVPEKDAAPKMPPVEATPFLERCRVAADITAPEEESAPAKETEAAETMLENMAEKILSDTGRTPAVSAATGEGEAAAPTYDGFSFDMGEAVRKLKNEKAPAVPEDSAEVSVSNEPADADAVPESTSDTVKEIPLNVEIIPEESSGEIMHTVSQNADAMFDGDRALAGDTVVIPEPGTKIYGKIVHGAVRATDTDGSDVNMTRVIKAEKETAGFGDGTIMFDGIKPAPAPAVIPGSIKLDDDDFDDDDGDDSVNSETYYLRPDTEAESIPDYDENCNTVKLMERLEKEHSSSAARAVLSFVLTAVMAVVSLPFVHVMGQKSAGLFSLLILIAAAIINGSVFKGIGRLFSGRPGFDTCSALVLIAGIVQTAVCTFSFGGKYCGTAAAVTVMLALEATAESTKTKRILNGFKHVASPGEKTAVVLLDGKTSAAVSRDAVDGTAAAAAGIKTEMIHNYLRRSAYMSPFDLKLRPMIWIGLAVSVVGAIAFGLITSDAGIGLCSLTLLLCTCFPASAVLTAELPLYFASNDLAKHDAMLAGFKGAHDINLANVVTVSGADLFPKGSISLYSMKPLSSHDVGNSIIDAAAVSSAAGSPFAPLFAGMLDSTACDSLPKVDGCQYEDKMGISGWIGERTVLIGNRNLMQGHNIPVPAISVDQKILHAGYFPVYVACDGVPCLLLMVRYDADPSIAQELKRLCATGMTVVADPRDPNMTDSMLADYFGLPNDAIKNMHNTGRFAYHKNTAEAKAVSASASYRGSVAGFFAAVTAAVNLNGAISAIRAVTALAEAIGIAALIWFCTTGKAELVCSLPFIAFQLLFTLLTLAVARLKR